MVRSMQAGWSDLEQKGNIVAQTIHNLRLGFARTVVISGYSTVHPVLYWIDCNLGWVELLRDPDRRGR